MKQAQIKLKHEESELKRKQADLKSTAKGYEKDKASMDNLDREKNKIQVFFCYCYQFIFIPSKHFKPTFSPILYNEVIYYSCCLSKYFDKVVLLEKCKFSYTMLYILKSILSSILLSPCKLMANFDTFKPESFQTPETP